MKNNTEFLVFFQRIQVKFLFIKSSARENVDFQIFYSVNNQAEMYSILKIMLSACHVGEKDYKNLGPEI